MLAYHNDPQIKQQILEQLQESGINLYPVEYEILFGIPRVLAYLKGAIFEGLPNDLAQNWLIRFIEAINVGADLSTIWRDFALWLLVDPTDGVIKYTQTGSDIHRVIMKVANLYRDGYTKKQIKDAADFAYAASYAAFSADSYNAAAHAYHAAAAVAAHDASYAAYAAAAAAVAAHDASYAASAAYNSDAAYDTAYIKMSNKFIELLGKRMPNASLL